MDSAVLDSRPEVKRARRRARRLARPAYVNTDATCRKGLAGLAYDSWALGQRIEVVACRDIVKAEHLALLMAMEDADRVLSGPVAFRVDSTAVANMVVGKKPRLDEVRTRIQLLLKRHPDWSLVLIESKRNKVANNLACRPFLEESACAPGGFERRGRNMVVLSPQLVDELRPYVYTVVGTAAGDVVHVTDTQACRRHPELLADPRERYEAACSLLDLFGWGGDVSSSNLKVDIRQYGWALSGAVETALAVANDTLKDLDGTLSASHVSPKSPLYGATARQAAILRDLRLTIDGHRGRVWRRSA